MDFVHTAGRAQSHTYAAKSDLVFGFVEISSEKFSTQLTDSQIKVIRFEFHFDGVISRIECTHKGCAGFPDNKKKHGTID